MLLIITVLGAAAWYFLSPVFISKEVNEEFPVYTVPPSNTKKQSFPTTEEIEAMPLDERERIKEEMMRAARAESDIITAEPMPVAASRGDEPTVLSTGRFAGEDSFHRAAGTATIYALPDGRRFLRFENFEVTNGPDLRVLLAKGGDPAQSIELGELKGNKGNQNYDIKESSGIPSYDSVIIYCKPFHVIFGTALLREP